MVLTHWELQLSHSEEWRVDKNYQKWKKHISFVHNNNKSSRRESSHHDKQSLARLTWCVESLRDQYSIHCYSACTRRLSAISADTLHWRHTVRPVLKYLSILGHKFKIFSVFWVEKPSKLFIIVAQERKAVQLKDKFWHLPSYPHRYVWLWIMLTLGNVARWWVCWGKQSELPTATYWATSWLTEQLFIHYLFM